MIKYSLTCDRDHGFESWFRDSAAYESLVAAHQIECAVCGSDRVRKALMAPSVVTARRKAAPMPEAPPVQPVAMVDDQARKLRDAVRKLHRAITENADNVGRAFPEEARRIHDGDAPPRSIYGEATPEQVSALLEDGISLLPMPMLPDDQN
jgi:hypothetical protein